MSLFKNYVKMFRAGNIAIIAFFIVLLLQACMKKNDFEQSKLNSNMDLTNHQSVSSSTTDKSNSKESSANIISGETKLYSYEIVRTFSHDPGAYTQGLLYKNGFLYESTGQYGSSSIRKIDPKTGKILIRQNLPFRYFGEGIAEYKDKIYMLTWENRTCFVFDINTLTQETTYQYQGEGWGLTSDGEFLYQSDGSSYIRIVEPTQFRTIKTLQVFNGNTPVNNLNELEFIGSDIYANVWMADSIARIDAVTGSIIQWIDLSPLREKVKHSANAEVLNGIAYNPDTKSIYVTGKLWPLYFELKLIEK